jgi:hypothetical protein
LSARNPHLADWLQNRLHHLVDSGDNSFKMKRTLDRAIAEKEPWLIWNAFIDLVAIEEAANLSELQQKAKLIFLYESEVQNGGHHQYFEIYGARHIKDTINALVEFGLSSQAKILNAAAQIWESKRRTKSRTFEQFIAGALKAEFSQQDSAFHNCKPSIIQGLEAHLENNKDHYVELI